MIRLNKFNLPDVFHVNRRFQAKFAHPMLMGNFMGSFIIALSFIIVGYVNKKHIWGREGGGGGGWDLIFLFKKIFLGTSEH